jgi:transcriptional regulator with XRE-family HTH domain
MMGARIAALRREAGMNQAQLARALQVSPSAVGMYEQGRREPSAQILLNLAEIFGVSVDYILSGIPGESEARKLERMLLNRITSADRKLDTRENRPFSREELAVLFAAMLLEP